jgi:septum formation protein
MLILASKSPVRRVILRNAGFHFEVQAASVDEQNLTQKALMAGVKYAEISALLAKQKATKVSQHYPNDMVIGADQTLDLAGRLYNKPTDLAEARGHLMQLRGKTHTLRTSITLAEDGKEIWHHTAVAQMTLRAFDESELDAILAEEREAVLDCVGAYRFEGPAIQLFERIEGDYFAILGLPILPLLSGLRQHAPHLLFGS